jgi:hypothetical protein
MSKGRSNLLEILAQDGVPINTSCNNQQQSSRSVIVSFASQILPGGTRWVAGSELECPRMAEAAGKRYGIEDLLRVMAKLRDPKDGCPWDLDPPLPCLTVCQCRPSRVVSCNTHVGPDQNRGKGGGGEFYLSNCFNFVSGRDARGDTAQALSQYSDIATTTCAYGAPEA